MAISKEKLNAIKARFKGREKKQAEKQKKFKKKYPTQIEKNYRQKIQAENERLWRTTEKFILPVLEHEEIPRADSKYFKLDVKNFIDELIEAFTTAKAFYYNDSFFARITKMSREAANEINIFSSKLFEQNFKKVTGVDPAAGEPFLVPAKRIFIQTNVSLIKTISSDYFDDIENIINLRVTRGDSTKKIKDEIQGRYNVTDFQAQRIARDQTNKFASSLDDERSQNNGLTRYIWHNADTSKRVRDDHKKLDGKIFEYKNPPVTVTSGKRSGETNNPGGDIQCRCWAEPVFDDLFEG